MFRALLLLLGLTALAACASLKAQENTRLDTAAGEGGGYRLDNLSTARSADELLVVVAFTGGGKRSAAFAYGAMTALRDMKFVYGGRERSLLHEIDVLSGVSGGSFPAAYYALHGDTIFQDFHRDFLDEDFNDDIAGIYLLPWHWDWMFSGQWGTNDEMAEIYDRLMFHGATFGDLVKRGPPFAMIQATDLANGAAFPFVQNQFDLICSDLSSYPIARAVAASNGFPILFTPITLKNYTANCPHADPAWVAHALADPDPLSRQRQQAVLARRYLRDDAARYVHLVDGGVGDNMAMRGILDYMARYDNPEHAAKEADTSATMRIRRVLFLSIDGQAGKDKEISTTPVVGDILRIVNAVSSNTIDAYNFETLRLARTAARNLAENLTRSRCAAGRGPGARGDMMHISLVDLPNADSLKNIPTGLSLDPAEVEALIEAGRYAVLSNRPLRQAIETIDAPDPCPKQTALR
ncbi:MAG: patatin-like phospholipase family protein [Alphaproteobacteria bacterium]|nr:patatin-like phospholipase family protein [Alphaproteobacteria bacterium]